jgi:hypothetical protein
MHGTEQRYLVAHIPGSDDANVFYVVESHRLVPFVFCVLRISNNKLNSPPCLPADRLERGGEFYVFAGEQVWTVNA